ncbi:MAG: 5'/3'-nucleotidase SurE [Elusimicrobiota bacterium]
MKRPLILVTNDDGIYGPGLKPLVSELKKIGKVIVVVPDKERSGTSHSITLHKPLRVYRTRANVYAANGTPADCARFGVLSLAKGKIDLLVSGINTGPNLGQDVIYSGTVAGAREGAMLRIPSFAISISEWGERNFIKAARVARIIAKNMIRSGIDGRAYLNVNVPPKIKGYRITSVGQRIYDEDIECRTDPRGLNYYWLAGKFISGVEEPGTDIWAIKKSFVSITPLELNPTAHDLFGVLEKWMEPLQKVKNSGK